MSKVSISIVMPLYNKQVEVGRAIASVLAQSVTDYELIVVNDGSTDNGPQVIESYTDSRIRMIRQVNGGVSAARNRGIEEARAELVAFLDADDEWFPDYLSSVMYLKNTYPDCDVFATSYVKCNGDRVSSPQINCLPSGFRDGVLNDYFRIAAHSDPPLWTSALSVNREAINSIGGFPVGVTSGEDLVTWAKLASRYKVAYLFEPKAKYYEPFLLKERAGRKPTVPDYVGNELVKLLNACESPIRSDVTEYIAFWLKMRAISYIFFNDNFSARGEIKKAMVYSPLNANLKLMYILLALPNKTTLQLYKLLRYLKHLRKQ